MNKVFKFLDETLIDLGRQFKWTYFPPLMIYMAAGISGLTGIVGIFFVKDWSCFISTSFEVEKICDSRSIYIGRSHYPDI